MRQANSNDPIWLERERLVLDQIERDIFVQLLHLRHNQQASAIGAGAGNPKVYQHHFDAANTRLTDISKELLPYLSFDLKKQHLDKLSEWREEYERRFGKFADPATQANIEQLKQHFLSQKRESRKKGAEEARRQTRQREKMLAFRQKMNWRDYRRAPGDNHHAF